jgi:hypothetical protein
MQSRFDIAAYRDRVQVETVMSMLKRRLEGFVRGRNAWSQRRELRLKVLTHNVMLLLQVEVFYRAVLTPFLSDPFSILFYREIATMQLKMQAVQAGLTSLWEVTLYPAAGRTGPPIWVVMPARNSRDATAAALQSNPGYVAGPVRRVAG